MVKALCYSSGGPGIESRWRRSPRFFSWIPTEPCALGSTPPLKTSTRDSPEGKGGRCVRLTLVVPNVKKSGALTYPDPLGPSRQPVVGENFTFTFYTYLPSYLQAILKVAYKYLCSLSCAVSPVLYSLCSLSRAVSPVLYSFTQKLIF